MSLTQVKTVALCSEVEAEVWLGCCLADYPARRRWRQECFGNGLT